MASKVVLVRSSQYANSIRLYKVYIDGLEVESIKNGETKEYELQPGKHRIQLELDLAKTDLIEFDLLEKSQKTFLCGSHIAGWKIFLVFIWFFFPHMWLYLKEA